MTDNIDSLEQSRRDALMEAMEDKPQEFLKADEAVAKKSEELMKARQARGYNPDWEEWVDAKRRMGRVMHHSEFLRRLRLIVPDLIATRGRVNGTISLYKIRNRPVDEAPNYWNPLGLDYFDDPEYIGWIHEGEMPEYEINIVNDAKIPIAQHRGWRTILLRMICRWEYEQVVRFTPGVQFEYVDKRDIFGHRIRKRRSSIITEEQALEAFGPPTQGATAVAYLQQLYHFRNATPSIEHPMDEEVKFGAAASYNSSQEFSI